MPMIIHHYNSHPAIPSDGEVRFYKRDRVVFGFLSNFYPAAVTADGETWPHTEGFYQSRKSLNPKYHERLREKEQSLWAKVVGESNIDSPDISINSWFRLRSQDLRPDWNSIKLDVMRIALAAKFTQHAVLGELLVGTEEAILIEDSKSDYFWGVGRDGSGTNWLGQLLMELRSKLRAERN